MELLWRGVGSDGVEEHGDYRAASVPRDDPRMWEQEALKLGDMRSRTWATRAKQGVGWDTSVTRDSQKEVACCKLVKGWWR